MFVCFFLFVFQKTEQLIDPVSVTLENLSGALLIGNGVFTTLSAAQSTAAPFRWRSHSADKKVSPWAFWLSCGGAHRESLGLLCGRLSWNYLGRTLNMKGRRCPPEAF
jgi:hypothetical protein